MKYVILLILFGFSLFSCTIVKRKYMPGYSVEWRKTLISQNHLQQNDSLWHSSDTDKLLREKNTRYAKNDLPIADTTHPTLLVQTENPGILLLTISQIPKVCDTIVLEDGTKIIAEVESISKRTITYRKCNDKNSISFDVSISKVSGINYSNGTKFIKGDTSGSTTKNKIIEKYGLVGSAIGVGAPLLYFLVASLNFTTPPFVFVLIPVALWVLFGISLVRLIKNRGIYKEISVVFTVFCGVFAFLLTFLAIVIIALLFL